MINYKKEEVLPSQNNRQTPWKRTTLARVVATDVYLDQIWKFIVQYVSEASWKLELGTIFFKKVFVMLGQLWKKVSQVTGN